MGIGASLLVAGCNGGGSTAPPPPPTKVTPTVTVTTSAASITTAQALTVTIAVSGNPAPTGSVTLTSGSYASSATALSAGSATITVAAGSLATGSDTLTGTYTPDAASSSTYNSASGTATETVTTAPNYVLTVNSTNPASGVTITVGNALNNLVSQGTTSFTESYPSGWMAILTAPATANGNSFSSWSGCTSASTVTCNVTMNANTTVTANYVTAPLTTPTVTVTPSAASIPTTQALTVTVAVSGGNGNPTPTGSVTLAGGGYTSAATMLSAGSATIPVPAGSLSAGNDTLTASYTPDAASSAVYNPASGTSPVTVTAATTYVLTVNSAAPSTGISINVTPADNNGASDGATSFTRTYNAAAAVSLTAPISDGSYSFVSWSGCTSNPSASICDVTMNANTTVTATYNEATVQSIAVTPSTATIGAAPVQFAATVTGTGAFSKGVTWSLSCPSCGGLSAGTLTSGGLYTTPYPAPATVTVTATSTMAGFTNVSGSATVALNPPATATGPSLTVNVGAPGKAISPDIYGMDAYLLDASQADAAAVVNANITVDRWGGDSTERYNYQLDVTSSIADYFFENQDGTGGDAWPAVNGVSAFDALVASNNSNGIKTLGTVPVLGWVAKDNISCSFPVATYPNQQKVDPYRPCGNGVYPQGVNGCTNANGCNITGNNPGLTSIAEPPPTPPAASAATTAWADATWAGGWTNYLVNKFGPGNPTTGTGTGVAIYDLDNEPSWWDAEDIDVHPLPFTYDEVTNGGIGTALAIKTVDPTAQVSGPVVDFWWNYFYSKKDVESGWNNGAPCYAPWSNPVDRMAHNGVPLIEYYLQQFASAQTTYGMRLLDYVDLHTYFAAQGTGLSPAGDTAAQQARLNSTRALWDSTYTDPSNSYAQPNYPTDPNYTGASNCSPPQQAPQLIPMMKKWVAADYPGTKLAIDEYNWGGMEAINGAVAQADILGIFGREGLDLGTMWPTDEPANQMPGMMAFAMYRNYDGKKSTFGDTVLPATSTTAANGDGEGQLAVYGGIHTSGAANGTVTVMVINKTYGTLTSTISLNGLSATATTAQAYLYSNSDLNAIVAQPAVTVTQGGAGGTISNYSFPAQSITLFVIPQ
jgi:hypothetical protein